MHTFYNKVVVQVGQNATAQLTAPVIKHIHYLEMRAAVENPSFSLTSHTFATQDLFNVNSTDRWWLLLSVAG